MKEIYQQHISTLRQRFDHVLEKTSSQAIAIYSGELRYHFQDDRPHPFQPNPLFKYWAPLTEHPHSWIYCRAGRKPVLVYHLPDDYWHLPPSPPDGFWTGQFDIVVTSSTDDFLSHFDLPAEKIVALGEADLMPNPGFAAVNPDNVINILHYQRAIKTAYEQACLRQASDIAVTGHLAAAQAFSEGDSEAGINTIYMQACEQTENQLPYGNIVALNEHCAVLHYQVQQRDCPDQHRSFLIDAGASYHGYASDITRTWCNDDSEFADLIAQMDEKQRFLVDSARAGVDYRDLHLSAHHCIAEVLSDSGLISMPADDIVTAGLSTPFFPHGLGHFLGLQVHDVGGFQASEAGDTIDRPEGHPYLRLTRNLEAGHVLTIEPGLYFIPSLLAPLRSSGNSGAVDWNRIDAMIPYGGIRIEDDIIVTEQAPVNLTRESFSQHV